MAIDQARRDLLRAGIFSGVRVMKAGADAGVSDITAVNYYKKWKSELPLDHKCRCGREYNHVGACLKRQLQPKAAPRLRALPKDPLTTAALAQPPFEHHSVSEWNQMMLDIRPGLYRYALGKLRNHSQAEDLVQQTLEKALRSRELYQKGTNFKAWIYRVMSNFHFGSYRHKPGLGLDHIAALEATTIPEQTSSSTLLSEIIVKIARLMPESRELCFCIWLDGLSYEETAARLGTTVGTVKSRLWRAKDRLREILGERSETDENRRLGPEN